MISVGSSSSHFTSGNRPSSIVNILLRPYNVIHRVISLIGGFGEYKNNLPSESLAINAFIVDFVFIGAGFGSEGVPPNTSNPTTKPTTKASAKAANAYHQKQSQAHNSQQSPN